MATLEIIKAKTRTNYGFELNRLLNCDSMNMASIATSKRTRKQAKLQEALAGKLNLLFDSTSFRSIKNYHTNKNTLKQTKLQ